MTETPKIRGSAGGQRCAILQREAALARYAANPNICETCAQTIPVKEGQKLAEVRAKRFCNHSCAAQFRNRIPGRRRVVPPILDCQRCGLRFPSARGEKGAWSKRSFCPDCLYVASAEAKGLFSIQIVTKGQLFSASANWQSARSTISRHARASLAKSTRPKQCADCGYAFHVDVCHIQAVSSFPDETLITVINSLENLVYLCKTHHWELDHPTEDPS